MPLEAPVSTPGPTVGIDHTAYPGVIDAIITAGGRRGELQFRATSRQWQRRIDRRILRHLAITSMHSNDSDIDCPRFEFRDREGKRLPIVPCELVDTHWAPEGQVARWPSAHCLAHTKVVDFLDTVHTPGAFGLPNLTHSRVHFAPDNDPEWQRALIIHPQPPASTVVIFAERFPRRPPSTRAPQLEDGELATEATYPDTVVISLLPRPYRPLGNQVIPFMWEWKVPLNLVVIVPGDFCWGQYNWLHRPWETFVLELGHLLNNQPEASDRGGKTNICVGLAEALTNTVRLLIDQGKLRGMEDSPLDVLSADFWETHDVRLRRYWGLGSVRHFLKRLDTLGVQCLSTEEYRATRTPEEFEAETMPNSLLMANAMFFHEWKS